MDKHTSGKKALRERFPALWYLEVIAVHPSLQSRGLGGGVMKAILEKVAGSPIFLECTKQENIAFYEGFGFRTIEQVEITDTPINEDENGKFKYWVMMREADSK
jgi:ribosomal protein S18 acetylase RimI-like enzyme